ncbi:hypothetical protein ACRAWD_24085 [Caulobacter segnis]
MVPLRAAAPFLPEAPRFEKDAPGRFAFADPDRVRAILQASGWRDVPRSRRWTPKAFSASKS